MREGDSFEDAFVSANFEWLGLERDGNAGTGVSVAIVDTLFEPPDAVKDRYMVGNTADFAGENDTPQRTWGHGLQVFMQASMIAPGAEFYFYRVKRAENKDESKPAVDLDESVDDEGEAGSAGRGSAFRYAFAQAIEDEVDVINLSAGVRHLFCDDCTVFERPLSATVNAGLPVVAAIGNTSDARIEHVLCPALHDSVVSVGGAIASCEQDASENLTDADDRRIWTSTRTMDNVEDNVQGPFCSFRGCTTKTGCGCRTERWWSGNIRELNGNPDVLAPCLVPDFGDEDGTVLFNAGTSFAAPIVTGVCTRLYDAVDDSDALTTHKLRRTLDETGERVEEAPSAGTWRRVNASAAVDALSVEDTTTDHPEG